MIAADSLFVTDDLLHRQRSSSSSPTIFFFVGERAESGVRTKGGASHSGLPVRLLTSPNVSRSGLRAGPVDRLRSPESPSVRSDGDVEEDDRRRRRKSLTMKKKIVGDEEDRRRSRRSSVTKKKPRDHENAQRSERWTTIKRNWFT